MLQQAQQRGRLGRRGGKGPEAVLALRCTVAGIDACLRRLGSAALRLGGVGGPHRRAAAGRVGECSCRRKGEVERALCAAAGDGLVARCLLMLGAAGAASTQCCANRPAPPPAPHLPPRPPAAQESPCWMARPLMSKAGARSAAATLPAVGPSASKREEAARRQAVGERAEGLRGAGQGALA